jgi:hypothetical protein
VAQALLIADVVATTVLGGGSVTALRPAMVVPLCVVTARAAIAWSVQSAARRASAAVTLQLRRSYLRQLVRLGPTWLESQRRSGLEAFGTRGLCWPTRPIRTWSSRTASVHRLWRRETSLPFCRTNGPTPRKRTVTLPR